MARLLSVGWELGSDQTTQVEGNFSSSTTDGGLLTADTNTVISGSYSLKCDLTSSSGSATAGQVWLISNTSSFDVLFTRVKLRIESLPTTTRTIFVLQDASAVSIVSLRIDSLGQLTLNDEDGTISSNFTTLNVDTTYRLELKMDRSGAGGSHVVEFKLDGSVLASSSTRNLSAGISRIGIGFLFGASDTGPVFYFDDFAVNDDTGSFQNDYPGDGKVIHLRPSDIGTTVDWVGDYTDVDEITPDDNTTKITTSDLNAAEAFTLDVPNQIGDGDTINCLQVGWRFNVNNTSGTQPTVVQQLMYSPKEGTFSVVESSAITFSSTSWNTHRVVNPRLPLLTSYQTPTGSNNWKRHHLLTAQIGARTTVNPTNNAQITTMWLIVDYTPGVAPKKPFLASTGVGTGNSTS